MPLTYQRCLICDGDNCEREYKTVTDKLNANVCLECLQQYGSQVGEARRAAVARRINSPLNDWLPPIPLTQVRSPEIPVSKMDMLLQRLKKDLERLQNDDGE